jgi:hypothetical protein
MLAKLDFSVAWLEASVRVYPIIYCFGRACVLTLVDFCVVVLLTEGALRLLVDH